MENVMYYGLYPRGRATDRPTSVARRRVVNGIIHDEIFTRQSRWEPTEFFLLYRIGHQDKKYKEISEEEVQAYIDRSEQYLREHPDQRDVVTITRPPGYEVATPRYPGDGLPDDW